MTNVSGKQSVRSHFVTSELGHRIDLSSKFDRHIDPRMGADDPRKNGSFPSRHSQLMEKNRKI